MNPTPKQKISTPTLMFGEFQNAFHKLEHYVLDYMTIHTMNYTRDHK